jgi:hypothetical protein
MANSVEDELRGAVAQARKDVAEHFEEWLDSPLVRLTISTIPAGDNKDALKALLRSAFESGFGFGAVKVVTKIAEMMPK